MLTPVVEVLRLDQIADEEQGRQWADYVRGLGVDPDRVCAHLAIYRDAEGRYHLHLSEKLPHPSGKGDWLDLVTDRLATKPVVIDLGHEQTWPETSPPVQRKPHDFSRALVDCRLGMKISREGWNASGQYVVFQAGYPNGIPINANTASATGLPEGTICTFRPYLMLCCSDGSFVPWQPTVSDLLATDWVTVE